jgi:hypothetical protein
VRRMVDNPELFANHFGHPLAGPHLSPKSVDRGSLGQQLFELRPLLFAQAWRRTWRGPLAESFYPALASPLHPLAHRSFGDAQSPSYIPLVPTLLLEFPGSEATTFSPIDSLAR